jgi:glycerophosphoryl diester phosphodiesterase
VSAPPPPASKSAAALVAREGVLVIAHRGASSSAPENTLPALRAGVEGGADLVELDYHHTRDGQLVVFHDRTLDRTTDAVRRWGGKDIALAGRELQELRELDAGAWFDPRFSGTRIPTLAEALDVVQADSVTLIERKAGDASSLLALLAERGETAQVVVQAFDWDFLADCRRQSSEVVLGALGSKALTAEKLDRIRALGAAVIGWNHEHVTPALVRAAHEHGLKVWVYTVNDPERARALVAQQVGGIITDAPVEISAALR